MSWQEMPYVVAEELFSINMNIVIVMFQVSGLVILADRMRTWKKRVSEVLQ